ncbi:Apolipoprotein [Trichinella spiralis]|uniref:Apolipoprotein n=1 Tax=Trichinella spiralis TaxID=6334 RepID=A0ABR3KJP6_TRISP
MKDTFIGAISPFDLKVCQFPVYISRFKQFLMVNGVLESKRAAVFFTVMGDEHFQLLTNLVVLKDPTTMSFDECVSVLTDHFQPPKLKKLSLNCAFDTHLPSALSDQFNLGLHGDVIKRRLFLQPDMTFEKVVQLAQQMEAADQEMAAWRPTVEEAPADQSPATVHQTQSSVQRRVKQTQRAPAQTGRYKKSGCHCCSKLDNWASGCPHKNDRCRLCGRVEHWKRMR